MGNKLKALFAVMLIGVLAIAMVGCSDNSDNASSDSSNLRFVTGGESGTYYAYGNVLGQYATNGDYGVSVTALSSEGSQANVQALQDGDADIAFCQGDVLAYAHDGKKLFEEPYTDFSVVANLYQETVQIVTCDPNIKSVADLKGKTVSIGAANSGVYFNAVDVLGVYGLSEDDITPVFQNFADSVDSLKDGKVDAAFITAGTPTPAVTDLATTKQAYLVSMDKKHIDELLKLSPYYSEEVIPADTYKGIDKKTMTVSVGAVVIASNEVSDDAIYGFTKSLFDGKENNADAHAKYDELDINNAASIASAPYHPGAAKYYEEQNVEVAGPAE